MIVRCSLFSVKGMVILLAVWTATGCVRPGGRKPLPANIQSATRQAWVDHSNRLSKSFADLAANPPKTVTEAAEISVRSDEESRKQFRKDMAGIMQPALPVIKDAKGDDTDDLDPLAAKRLFGEIAKGLKK